MPKTMTPRYRSIMEDIISGKFDNFEISQRHKITTYRLEQVCNSKLFRRELSRRIAIQQERSRQMLIEAWPAAVSKLLALIDSEKEETARKACLDIISTIKECEANEEQDGTKSVSIPEPSPQACELLASIGRKTR